MEYFISSRNNGVLDHFKATAIFFLNNPKESYLLFIILINRDLRDLSVVWKRKVVKIESFGIFLDKLYSGARSSNLINY